MLNASCLVPVRQAVPRAALDRLDLDALDIELDQVFSAGSDLAVIDQVVERDHRDLLAAGVRTPCDAEGLMLGAGQSRLTPRGPDRAFHRLETVTVDLRIVGEFWKIL